MEQISAKRAVTAFLGIFLLVCFIMVGFSSTAGAAGYAMIVLKSEEPANSPDPLKTKLGASVIWINENPEPVTIKITTKVGLACKAPINFYADIFGYYETPQIPQGATASICFVEKGKYEYEVKQLVGKEKPVEKILTGTIIVE